MARRMVGWMGVWVEVADRGKVTHLQPIIPVRVCVRVFVCECV
jgi:hypothetical protein